MAELAGQVFVAPLGSTAWVPLAAGSVTIKLAADAEERRAFSHLLQGGTITTSGPMHLTRFGRRWVKAQRHYALSPRPLAPGCLPASKMRGRRR